jgi:hypothetical protein
MIKVLHCARPPGFFWTGFACWKSKLVGVPLEALNWVKTQSAAWVALRDLIRKT